MRLSLESAEGGEGAPSRYDYMWYLNHKCMGRRSFCFQACALCTPMACSRCKDALNLCHACVVTTGKGGACGHLHSINRRHTLSCVLALLPPLLPPLCSALNTTLHTTCITWMDSRVGFGDKTLQRAPVTKFVTVKHDGALWQSDRLKQSRSQLHQCRRASTRLTAPCSPSPLSVKRTSRHQGF